MHLPGTERALRNSFLASSDVEKFHSLVKERENKHRSMRLRKPYIRCIQAESSLPTTSALTNRLWKKCRSPNLADDNQLLKRCSSSQEACYAYRAAILYTESRHLATGSVDCFYIFSQHYEDHAHTLRDLYHRDLAARQASKLAGQYG